MAHQIDATHIPQFAKPLAPYIKSRQEALRIRQALTLYLRSHIVFADDDSVNPECHAQSHLSLCAPHDAVADVKRIPADLTGLRKEYLKALQANVTARKEYNAICESVATKNLQTEGLQTETHSAEAASSELQTYLRLLRDRRRHAKLQVFQHYLQELKGRDVARSEYFDVKCHQSQKILSDEIDDGTGISRGPDNDVEELVHKLEKAVIRAKSQLDREKKLLEELQAQQESEKQPREGIPPTVKAMALQRTRDELVQWVEDKLVSVGGNEETPLQEFHPEEVEDSAHLIEDLKAQIKEQYAAYVQARRGLLEAISGACQPVSVPPRKHQARFTDSSMKTTELPPLEVLDVLQFASEVLLPLSKTQRALALQKSYLSGMLTKEKSTTLRILNRLRDESHLLPEYPILSRQPRFKHAVAALGSRRTANSSEQNKADEIVTLAEAWAFASDAARTTEREYVEQKTAEGVEIASDAQQALEKVYCMLNQDIDETIRDDEKERDGDGTDVWTYEARSTGLGLRGRPTDKLLKGPWSRLNGRVGVPGDS